MEGPLAALTPSRRMAQHNGTATLSASKSNIALPHSTASSPLPHLLAHIVVIKKSGKDGPKFPMQQTQAIIGRHMSCDIRIQLPHVSKQHSKISVDENRQLVLENLSTSGSTLLNQSAIAAPTPLQHGDVFIVGDRAFRIEYINSENIAATSSKDVAGPSSASLPVTTPLKPRTRNSLAPASASNKTPKSKTPRCASVAKTPKQENITEPAPTAAAPSSVPVPVAEAEPESLPSNISMEIASTDGLLSADELMSQEQSLAPVAEEAPSSPLDRSLSQEAGLLSPSSFNGSSNAASSVESRRRQALPTPLRASIHSAASSGLLKPKLGKMAKLATPMKKAIAEKAARIIQPKPATKIMPTPLKKAILHQAETIVQPKPVLHSLATPLKKDIAQAAQTRATRRRSARLSGAAAAAAPVEQEAEQKQTELELPADVEAEAAEAESQAIESVPFSLQDIEEDEDVEMVDAEEAVDAQHEGQEVSAEDVALVIEDEPAVQMEQDESNADILSQRESIMHLSREVLSEVVEDLAPAPEELEEEINTFEREPTVRLEMMVAEESMEKAPKRRGMPTPMRKAIVQKQEELVHPKPTLRSMPTPMKRSLIAQHSAIVKEKPALRAMPTPLRQGIKQQQSLIVQPKAQMRLMSRDLQQSIKEQQANIVQPKPTMQVMATPMKKSLRAAAQRMAEQHMPVPTMTLPTPLKKEIKNVKKADKPRPVAVMNTPMKRQIRQGRAQLKPVPVCVAEEDECEQVEVEDVEAEATDEIEAAQPASIDESATAHSSEEDEEESAPVSQMVAPASAPRPRVPRRLAPGDRKMIARRHAQTVRVKKSVSSKRTTASNMRAHKERLRMAAKAKLPKNVVNDAEIGERILNNLSSLLEPSSTPEQEDVEVESMTRGLVQPIFEQLTGMKNDAVLAAQMGPLTPLRIEAGCNSSVNTPVTPATGIRASSRCGSLRPLSSRRSSMTLPSARLSFGPSTPRTPSASAGSNSLVTNLRALFSTPASVRAKLSRKKRDSIDAIFADLLELELHLDEADEEDVKAEQERIESMKQQHNDTQASKTQTSAKVIQTPAKSSAASTPLTRHALPTPIRSGIASAAAARLARAAASVPLTMASPFRQALLARQASVMQCIQRQKPKKALTTSLRQAIKRGTKLAPVPVKQHEVEEVESETDEPIGLSIFDGLEALEEAMYAIAEENEREETDATASAVEPIAFSLSDEQEQEVDAAGSVSVTPSRRQSARLSMPTTSSASSRRASRRSFGRVSLPPVVDEKSRQQVAQVVEALEEAIVAGFERMIVAQTIVEQAEQEAEQEQEDADNDNDNATVSEEDAQQEAIEVVRSEPVATEEPKDESPAIEAVSESEVAASSKQGKSQKKKAARTSKKGSKRTRATKASTIDEEEEALQQVENHMHAVASVSVEPSPKKQKVETTDAEVQPEPVPAAPRSRQTRRRTAKPSKASTEDESIVPQEQSSVVEAAGVEEIPAATAAPLPSTRRRTVTARRQTKLAVTEPQSETASEPAVEEVKKNEAEVESEPAPTPAPAKGRSTRGRKRAALKDEEKPAPQPEEVKQAEEAVIEPPPKRTRSRRAAAAAAPVESDTPEVSTVVEAVSPPARATRKRKSASVAAAPAAAAVDVEVQPQPEPESELIQEVPAKRTRGKSTKKKAAAVAEVEAEDEQSAPAASEPVARRRTRRTATAAAAPEVEAAALTEQVEDASESVASSSKRSTRRRKQEVNVDEEQQQQPEETPTQRTRTRSIRSRK